MSRILYIAHDVDQPRGGVDVLYDHVAVLRERGLEAFIVHTSLGFRYRFARREVPVLYASPSLDVLRNDVLVIPEDYAAVIKKCRDISCRKVLFCQGHYQIFKGIAPGETWSDYGFSAYICVSTPIRQAIKRWFGIDANVVRPCIDPAFFVDTLRPIKSPLIVACMPRNGMNNIRLVQGLIAATRAAGGARLSWLEIDGLPREQVVARLQEAHIYLATSVREGLGLPPLEAMAAGCLVVGFIGGGGLDYASPENGVWVEDDNPWALAEALEHTVAALADPNGAPLLDAKRAAGRLTASTYNRDRFERDLMAFWTGQLDAGVSVDIVGGPGRAMATTVSVGDDAEPELAEAISVTRSRPDDAAAWVRLGQAFIAARQTQSAPRCFARAAELEPQSPQHAARLGKLLLALRHYDKAQDALRRACALAPESAQCLWLLGYALREQNDIDGALAAYARGCQIDPENLHCAVAESLLLPPVYRDADDVRRWRARFEAGLARLHEELPKHRSWHGQVLALEWENFSLAYQGEDDRRFQERYSDFVANLLAQAVPELQAPLARPTVRGRRIRVGFLSAELRTCTIGDYFASWMLDLPRDRFEVWCYFTGYLPDALTAKLAAACDRFQILDGSVDSQAAVVRGDPPDILIFPDVGMTSQSTLLANLRLAHVQCAAWGHPVTTGSRYIDHFLSCGPMEPVDAAAHYRENLILLPELGVRYELPLRPEPRTRAHFGLPEHARIYVCPNRLHKILPGHDALFLGIVAEDPQAVLVFFDSVAPGQRRAFVDRLQRGMAARGIPPRQQIKFLPALPRAEFRCALAVADVMLDTPNFSGGSSALDALAVGLPIVAREGRFMRGRQSAAMLRIVGVPEQVVESDRHYVELALRVAKDRVYRNSISDRITAGLSRLFGRDEPVGALAEALVKLVS
jgi:protein O-GlcNAc transferase